MSLEVYWGSGSPFAWRVLLTLEIKGLRYDSRRLEFSKREHKEAAYVALNPRGQVPTLRDGDYVLTESLAIMAYLEAKFPEPPLFGRSPEEKGRIWEVVSEIISNQHPLASRIATPLFFGGVAEKADDIQAAATSLRAELAGIEQRLSRGDWLASGSLSAADIVFLPLLELLLRAFGKEAAAPLKLGFLPLGQQYPAIDAWRGRMKSLPGYDRTYPPHWREAA